MLPYSHLSVFQRNYPAPRLDLPLRDLNIFYRYNQDGRCMPCLNSMTHDLRMMWKRWWSFFARQTESLLETYRVPSWHYTRSPAVSCKTRFQHITIIFPEKMVIFRSILFGQYGRPSHIILNFFTRTHIMAGGIYIRTWPHGLRTCRMHVHFKGRCSIAQINKIIAEKRLWKIVD